MNDELKELIDVHAVAYVSNGNYQFELVDAPPANLDAYAKVIEPMGDGRQLVLWVPEGTPGTAYALQGADTLQTGAFGADGRFVLGSLAAGSYEVLLHPAQAYRDTTLTDVVVNPTETTDVGDVELTPQ